jgi:hypothetical protein
MKHRKIIPGFFDDNELNILSVVLDRVVLVMVEMGAYSEKTNDSYRTRVASLIIDIAKHAECDADYLTQLTLERIAKPEFEESAGGSRLTPQAARKIVRQAHKSILAQLAARGRNRSSEAAI